MSADEVSELANAVKKFFYRRAFLAEQMCDEGPAGCKNRLTIDGERESLAPDSYEPLDNLYPESRIVTLVAIEGLASLWESLEVIPQGNVYGRRNQARFSDFLKRLNFNDTMPRICTPVLVYTLEQLELEDYFRQVVFQRWVKQDDAHTVHPDHKDPSIDELDVLYAECKRDNPQPPHKTIKTRGGSLIPVWENFQYSALIYKYFRNSLVHEYRPSNLTSSFARGNEIMVQRFTGRTIITITPEGEIEDRVEKFVEGPIPQLDIGLGVLTAAVRVGADFIADLIRASRTTELPYSAVLIEVKPEAKPPKP